MGIFFLQRPALPPSLQPFPSSSLFPFYPHLPPLSLSVSGVIILAAIGWLKGFAMKISHSLTHSLCGYFILNGRIPFFEKWYTRGEVHEHRCTRIHSLYSHIHPRTHTRAIWQLLDAAPLAVKAALLICWHNMEEVDTLKHDSRGATHINKSRGWRRRPASGRLFLEARVTCESKRWANALPVFESFCPTMRIKRENTSHKTT